jgi:hypothetical protein
MRHGGSWWSSVLFSLGCTLVALIALLASIPLWFVPPLVLVVPPLIWGWLTYRVMTFDVLAEHASRDERRRILREQRWPLLVIGVVTGYLGAAPSLLWAMSAMTFIIAPLLIVASVWLYTLVFASPACGSPTSPWPHCTRLRAADAGSTCRRPPLRGRHRTPLLPPTP